MSTTDMVMKLVPRKDLAVPLAPRVWMKLRRTACSTPEWSQLSAAALWKSPTYEVLRRRLRQGESTGVKQADAGPGQTARILELYNEKEVEKELVYGELQQIISFRRPHQLLVEVGPEEELTQPMEDMLEETGRPFVLFGDWETVYGWKLVLSTYRKDVMMITVGHCFKEYAKYPKLAATQKGELYPRIGALLAHHTDDPIPPVMMNRDLRTDRKSVV